MNNELVAIPVFQERISPLLDEARRFILFEIAEGGVSQKIVINIDLDTCAMRIARLKEMGVTSIVSGAVSGDVSDIIIAYGIHHYPWNNGYVSNVIELFLDNRLRPCRASFNQCGLRTRRKRCCSPVAPGSANRDKGEKQL